MALSKVKGYNILLTIGAKSIVGTTSDTLSGGGVLKESIQKSDAGQTKYNNTGFEGTMSVSSFVGNGTAASGELGLKELMIAARDNATGAFIYTMGSDNGDPKITGTCTYTSITVNSNSEDYADCTIELGITSLPIFTTV